jgi:hypothetical protein
VCAPATLRRTTTWVGATAAAPLQLPLLLLPLLLLPLLLLPLPACQPACQTASGVQVHDRLPLLLCMLCRRSGSWRGWGG